MQKTNIKGKYKLQLILCLIIDNLIFYDLILQANKSYNNGVYQQDKHNIYT